MKCIAPVEKERRRCPYTDFPISESPDAQCAVDPNIKKRADLPCEAAALFAKLLTFRTKGMPVTAVDPSLESTLAPLDNPEVQEITRKCIKYWGPRTTLITDKRAGNLRR